ncbi:MAG: PQQ-binding-like beta-propeller repeat protein [Gammaproteobacteria bacterium]|nr:PQQ-binding-like beta-propeller repeat protein [Gammaproteobacteria bacterium]
MRMLGGLILFVSALTAQAADTLKNDGATLFQANCARCHDRALPRMPSREGLKEKEARDVFTTISAGVMAPYARTLSHAERRAVAEFATGKSLGEFAAGAAAIPATAYCKAGPAKPLSAVDSGWNGWGNNLANTRFQTAARAGLTAEDVARLGVKWTFGVPAVTTMSGHPVVADGRLFFGTFSGLLIALDAEAGCALWVYEAHAGIRTSITLGKLGDGSINLFFGDLSGQVYALDPATGHERWSMVADSHPHIRVTGTPVYHDNRLYVPLSSLEEVAGAMPDYECCTFRGGVMALDAATGKEIWKTHTIAEAPSKRAKNAVGTQLWGPSGAAVWSAPTLDPATNTLYITTGDSYSEPPAKESDAIMALTMDTGKVRWIRQTLAGDSYTIACADPSPLAQVACPKSKGPDLDYGSSPVLITRADGTRLLLAGQKSGELYALNPTSGEILWKTVVGAGGIVGGIEWGFAVDNEKAYVAISEAWEKKANDAGGLSAVNLNDGSVAWHVAPAHGTCDGHDRCNTGQLAAVTGIPGVVFSGSLDGHLRGYSTVDGKVLWDLDTRQEFKTVNGVAAHGGSLNGPGPAVANGVLYVVSGYAMWNKWTGGNALIAISVGGR